MIHDQVVYNILEGIDRDDPQSLFLFSNTRVPFEKIALAEYPGTLRKLVADQLQMQPSIE